MQQIAKHSTSHNQKSGQKAGPHLHTGGEQAQLLHRGGSADGAPQQHFEGAELTLGVQTGEAAQEGSAQGAATAQETCDMPSQVSSHPSPAKVVIGRCSCFSIGTAFFQIAGAGQFGEG